MVGQLDIHATLEHRLQQLREEPARPGQRHTLLVDASHQPVQERVVDQLLPQPTSRRRPATDHSIGLVSISHRCHWYSSPDPSRARVHRRPLTQTI